MEGAEWRLLRRFDHHRVSATQRRSNFPGKHQQRKVPLREQREKEQKKYLKINVFQVKITILTIIFHLGLVWLK